jgi:hypothetical protein
LLSIPFTGDHCAVRLRHFAREAEEHGKSKFRRGDGVAGGRVHHDDAALRGGFHVHIVHPDAGATDDAELGRGFENFLGHFRFGADDHGDGVSDDGEQFRFGETFREDDDLKLGSLLKQGDAFRRNRVTYQNLHKNKDGKSSPAAPKVKLSKVIRQPGGAGAASIGFT